jgi:sialic acid synthase SpsE
MSVLVIAEPGGTHEGQLDTMLALVEAAAEAGANVYKATWIADVPRVLDQRHITDPTERDYYARVYAWHAWPIGWHDTLRARCHESGLLYGCTTHTREAVRIVAPYVDLHKVASFEAMHRPLLDAHEDAGGHLVISTGMLTAEEVRFLDGWRKRGNNLNRRVDLLHCTSAYPAPLEDMNLQVCAQAWCDGLSDHSKHVSVGSAAAALGARVIEAHLRLDDCDPENPDYAVAFDPDEFERYVTEIRLERLMDWAAGSELVLGDGQKRPMPSEQVMSQYRVTA